MASYDDWKAPALAWGVTGKTGTTHLHPTEKCYPVFGGTPGSGTVTCSKAGTGHTCGISYFGGGVYDDSSDTVKKQVTTNERFEIKRTAGPPARLACEIFVDSPNPDPTGLEAVVGVWTAQEGG